MGRVELGTDPLRNLGALDGRDRFCRQKGGSRSFPPKLLGGKGAGGSLFGP
jgi:hypothetical protein